MKDRSTGRAIGTRRASIPAGLLIGCFGHVGSDASGPNKSCSTGPSFQVKPLIRLGLLGLLIVATGCSREPTTQVVQNDEPITYERTQNASSETLNVAETTDPDKLQPPEVDQPTSRKSTLDAHQESELASAALSKGDSDTAYVHARNAVRADPNDPQVLFVMARVLGDRHRYPEAIRILDRVAQQDPAATFPALGQSAQWLVLSGDWTEAERRYRLILREVPDAMIVQRELASLLIRQGRRYEAASFLRSLCRQGDLSDSNLRSMLRLSLAFGGDSRSKQLEPIGRLGVARNFASQGLWSKALETLRGPKLHHLELPELELEFEAVALAMLDKQDKLAECVEQRITTHGPDAWFARGVYEYSVNHHDAAARCFAEVILQDPTNLEAYQRLAVTVHGRLDDEVSQSLRERIQWIEATHVYGAQLAVEGTKGFKHLDDLADVLVKLRRTDESIAWQAIKAAYSSSLSESERREIMAEINRERIRMQNTVDAVNDVDDQRYLLAGLSIADLRAKHELHVSE